MFLIIILIILTISVVVYYYLICNYNYWKVRNVPGPKPSLIFGNTKDSTLLKMTIAERIREIYQSYHGFPYVGIFELRSPALILRDPNLIKLVMLKNFDCFQSRGIVINEETDPLSANLINLTGHKWRILRSKLTPAFTSGKLKQMFPLMAESSEKFKKFVIKYADSNETVEMRDLAAKFATDVISTCCFGLETNSIQNSDSEFRMMCKRILDPSWIMSFKRSIRWYLPGVFKYFGMSLNPEEVSAYFFNLVQNMIQYRETNNYIRHDIMQLLIQLKDDKRINKNESKTEVIDDKDYQEHDDIVIDDDIIAAQAYVFLLAGFETSSTTMSFTMYELAANPHIQQKVYNEIKDTINKYGELSYEAMSEMEYLDCVIKETLRKHPPVGVVPRVCNKDYLIPGTNVKIEKGLKVLIPIHAIHHDAEYYPNSEEYDPSRFLDKNKKFKDSCTYLPFGAGPRKCIGMKFAYTQTKVGLIALLSDYEVILDSKMTKKLKYDPTANILTNKQGILLKIRWRNSK
ncbi:cytochrome P450 6B5-like, partial [Chelonus insularis]|uniref:cytochrome P450 6B5-like n=1 Tax=Chelonus insularis TaxID=460826 RepID=UPI00158B86AA